MTHIMHKNGQNQTIVFRDTFIGSKTTKQKKWLTLKTEWWLSIWKREGRGMIGKWHKWLLGLYQYSFAVFSLTWPLVKWNLLYKYSLSKHATVFYIVYMFTFQFLKRTNLLHIVILNKSEIIYEKSSLKQTKNNYTHTLIF